MQESVSKTTRTEHRLSARQSCQDKQRQGVCRRECCWIRANSPRHLSKKRWIPKCRPVSGISATLVGTLFPATTAFVDTNPHYAVNALKLHLLASCSIVIVAGLLFITQGVDERAPRLPYLSLDLV